MIATELSGGYGNLVTLEGSVVRKQFKDNPFTKVSYQIRKKREALNLRYFANSGLTPELIEENGNTLLIEYIPGESYLERLKQGEDVIYEAGRLLKSIHRPVERPVGYLRDAFEKKSDFALEQGRELLGYLGVSVDFSLEWPVVFNLGTTRIHGDYWLANIVGERIIDWEFGRIGTPYQDFAAMELWTFHEYGGREQFWRGYGESADQRVINEYVKFECLDFLGDICIEDFKKEDDDGFYHQKVELLKML